MALTFEPLERRTLASVTLLKDVAAGAPSSSPHDFFRFGDTAFFTATIPMLSPQSHGSLYATDGTPGGTHALAAEGVSVSGAVRIGDDLWAFSSSHTSTYSFNYLLVRLDRHGHLTTWQFGGGDSSGFHPGAQPSNIISVDGQPTFTYGYPDRNSPNTSGYAQIDGLYTLQNGSIIKLRSFAVGEALALPDPDAGWTPQGPDAPNINGGTLKAVPFPAFGEEPALVADEDFDPSLGTGGNDVITLYRTTDNYGLPQLTVNLNGVLKSYHLFSGGSSSPITIFVDAGAGNDRVDVYEAHQKLGANVFIRGGAGNDTINAGSGDDTLYGGDGNDVLNARGGHDSLFGDAGNDTLMFGVTAAATGGAGRDHFAFDGYDLRRQCILDYYYPHDTITARVARKR